MTFPTHPQGVSSYYEANIMGTAVYPQAIKMVIANFAALFGTPRVCNLLRQYLTHLVDLIRMNICHTHSLI